MLPIKLKIAFYLVLLMAAFSFSLEAQKFSHTTTIAVGKQAKYPSNFKHFDYVNPSAPKAGELVLAALGSFDSLHPFIIKGEAASGIAYIYDTLLASQRRRRERCLWFISRKSFI